MRQTLRLHPDSTCPAVTGIAVEVARPGPHALVLHYFVTGRLSDLRLPPVQPPARRDELWRQTCFEAFVRSSSGAAYYEFNFSPSTEWAAYRFDGYRSGMRVAPIGQPHIETQSTDECTALRASLALPDLPGDAAWQLGLSSVIEEASGRKSWWALAHPPGNADFHHPDCFTLELPPM